MFQNISYLTLIEETQLFWPHVLQIKDRKQQPQRAACGQCVSFDSQYLSNITVNHNTHWAYLNSGWHNVTLVRPKESSVQKSTGFWD